MIIKKANLIGGRIELPGDKSISHRAAMLLSAANGTARISNFAASADCSSTLDCLGRLGVQIERSGTTVEIAGVGKRGFRTPTEPLDCGNSGTTMRLLAGLLAGQDVEAVLTGDSSLSGRPMKRVIDPLEKMGARIDSNSGTAPLAIKGTSGLRAIEHTPPVPSAQIKSCVLLAGLNASGTTTVHESTPTRDHTERMLRWLGVEVSEAASDAGTAISVNGQDELVSRDIEVPADISSAAFLMAAAIGLPGSEVVLPGVGLNPSRTGIIDVMLRLGADLTVSAERSAANEPAGDIRVRSGFRPSNRRERAVISGPIVANIIDEIPILAVLGTQLDGGLEIRNAAELRVKESDRISAVVENLRRMNANVEEFDDGLFVGRSQLNGAPIETFGDHRIAMAFAVAGLFADGDTRIADAACAAVSFPNFFDILELSVQR